ncbi:MAG TPA: UDP-N-acetylmuramoyl-tripeptide--D-alanyl-D-alanine ligase [Methylophilaceae bacterium]|nr:UDP-N-acetylmuramoyl-tripeptide--D-alanyl-D-alanine ligase [Methylophilaceae bacterium]
MMHLSEAAIATRGRVVGQDVLFNSVGTDSRSLSRGQLFVALKGEHFDGHAYVQQSLSQGALAAMVSVDQPGLSPILLVKDTRLSLGDLAAYWRRKFAIPLVAITGSNGKTTVKEMLASILHAHTGDAGSVLATQGNLNNDIGLPLTLLKLRQHHRYAVVEMGMNHAGEISYLTTIGRPTAALINNATSAHLAGLGSVEEIAKAKGEIFEGLAADGIAVINADDAFAPLWKKLAAPHQIMTFGLDTAADVSAVYQLKADGSDIQIHALQGVAKTYLPVPGLHNVRNALAAAAVALAMQIPLATVAKGLAGFSGVKGRLQHKTGINGALVIDDTYNANPASMKAAIDVLATRPEEKLLVLGDMAELGSEAAKMHAEIGSYSKAAGIKTLYALGDLSRETVKAFGKGAKHYASPEALAHDLVKSMKTGVAVLVKGSRFMQMERVAELITTELIVTDKNREMH